MSLKNKTILITRRPEQAREMIAEIERLGGSALLAPMIEIADPESWDAADRAIGILDQYDVLVLASANAAERFLGRCDADGLRKIPPVYAIGSRTREAVGRFGLRTEELPEEYSATGLGASLDPGVVHGKRVLLPRGDRSRDDLPRILRGMGADVETPVVYRTLPPREADAVLLRNRLRGGEIDVVTFASPSAVGNFLAILGPDLHILTDGGTRVAVIGPTTAEAARQAGVPVSIVAAESTGLGLVRSIAEHFQ